MFTSLQKCLKIFLFPSERFIIVSTALFVHFTKICCLGLCGEEVIIFETTFASYVFILAFALLFSDYDWVPTKINNTSRIAAFIMKIGAITLATNLVLNLVWDPLSIAIDKVLKGLAEYVMDINYTLYLNSNSVFACIAEMLEEEVMHSLLLTFIAFVCLYWVLDGLGYVEPLMDKIHSVMPRQQDCIPCSRDNTPKRQRRLNK